MASDLIAALEEARRGLLDLSTRNRLLALPAPGRARGCCCSMRRMPPPS